MCPIMQVISLRHPRDPHPGRRREGRLRNACEVAGLGDSILILNVAPSRSLSEVDIFNLGCEKQWSAVIIQVAAVAWRRQPFQIVLPNCGTKRNRQTGRSLVPRCACYRFVFSIPADVKNGRALIFMDTEKPGAICRALHAELSSPAVAALCSRPDSKAQTKRGV